MYKHDDVKSKSQAQNHPKYTGKKLIKRQKNNQKPLQKLLNCGDMFNDINLNTITRCYCDVKNKSCLLHRLLDGI